jgi:hypothetical protein
MIPAQAAKSQCIDGECLVFREHGSKWNLEELTETEIQAAIRYLDPDAEGGDESHRATIFVLTVMLLMLLLACIWMYQRIS